MPVEVPGGLPGFGLRNSLDIGSIQDNPGVPA